MIGQGLPVILPQSHKVNTVGMSNFKMAVLHFVNVTKEEIKSDIRKFHSTKHKNLESAQLVAYCDMSNQNNCNKYICVPYAFHFYPWMASITEKIDDFPLIITTHTKE